LAILSEFTIPSVLYGKVLEQIAATRGSGTTSAGKLAATDTFAQWSYVQLQTTQYTDCCFAASQRFYKLIPASGAGTSGTNYDEIDFGYDVMRTETESGLSARNQIAANLSAWEDHEVRTKRVGLVQRAEDWRSGSFNRWLYKPERDPRRLTPWSMSRLLRWAERVNKPLTAAERHAVRNAVRTRVNRGTPLGDET
jgi:hypothetical protein